MMFGLIFPVFAGGKGENENSDNSESNRGNSVTEHEVRPLAMGDEVVLDLETGGSLDISVSRSNEVVLDITRYGEAVDLAEIRIRETVRGLSIRSRYRTEPRGWKHGVDIKLKVPSSCNLTIDTLGGNVRIDGVSGTIKGKTLGGNLILSNLEGLINMETLGGHIEISSSTLDGSVKTLGGDIRVRELQGNLKTNSLGGQVIYEDTIAGQGQAPVIIDSLGGNIEIDEASAGIEAKTLGGDININRAAVYVDLETLGGNIDIGSIDGRIYASSLGGNVSAVMTGDPGIGDREVTMSSLGGDVTLRVPGGLGMDVDITIEITKTSLKDYRIIAEPDLEFAEREATPEEARRDVAKVLTARGIVGDGEHRIRLSTTNGDITLEQDG